MIVVSNTSPLNYLILIKQDSVLERLYGKVFIPLAVAAELQAATAPKEVRSWMAALPAWCEVHAVTLPREASLSHLHAGEHEAILLAQEKSADAIIMDEADGRAAASLRGIQVTGTLGVLDEAAERGLLDFPKAVSVLKTTSFHATDKLYQQFLDRDTERKNRGLRPRV